MPTPDDEVRSLIVLARKVAAHYSALVSRLPEDAVLPAEVVFDIIALEGTITRIEEAMLA